MTIACRHRLHLQRAAQRLCASVLIAVACATAPAIHAQAYPSRAIHLVVPFAPGGGNDFIARFVAQHIAEGLGQPVIVENKPGAGGMLGTEQVLSAPADGYTLLLVSLSYVVNPSLYPVKFDPLRDMTPVIQVSQGPLVIVTNPAVPVQTTAELIALAKAKPGALNYASSGAGSIIHLASEYFATTAGIRWTHVPYKGGGPALADTLGGQTQVFFSSTAAALPQIKAGKLRPIAVTTPARNAALPEVPAVAETLPGFDVTLWHGIIGPKGMPPAVVARINAEVTKALALPEAVEVLRGDGVSPAPGTPAQFEARLAQGLALWGKVAKAAGVKPDQ